MLTSFKQIIENAKCLGQATISVAAAQDKEVLEAIKAAYDAGIAKAILVGDEKLIRPMIDEVGLPGDIRVIDEPDLDQAAYVAVDLIIKGEAQVYMKGLLNSSNYLKAALNADHGLRKGSILSMLACNEIAGEKKLIFISDGGVNIAPTLDEKKQILTNALEALIAMGIEKPKVAVLAANEAVNPKMPVTIEAKAIADAAANGEFPPGIVEGPMALDVAYSAEAAKHKGITSQIAGDVDLLLVPDIEAGNLLGKSMVNYAKSKNAGVILGATNPMVLTSRSESAEAKLNSVAMACLIAGANKR